MQLMNVTSLLAELSASGKPYQEFLRSADLSLGLYVLAAGAVDAQQPHSEDEVYFVLEGRGLLHAHGTDLPVHPGSLAFVPAHALHYFHSIEEPLKLLVIFGPAEHTRRGAGAD
jgi:mannose-6-phosphate isomerase-like protein (cupin superfamily)